MIRVGFDIAQTAAERAGCAWYADGLARALARRPGIELHAYTQFGGWLNEEPATASHIEGGKMMLADLTCDQARAFWKTAATSGLPEAPAIVHSNSFQAPLVPGSHLVFTIHDLSFWTHPAFASEATRQVCQRGVLDALERAAGLVFVSEAARAEFESVLPRWLERSRRPVAIIPGASRFTAEPRSTPPAAAAPWLCVGSIEPRKNHATLLDAYEIYCRQVASPRPLHLIGGRGWHSDEIHGRIASLTTTNHVHHPGYVSETELTRQYRDAFAVVQPSWHEGFGLPVVEALGFGVPVICSDIPSLREIADGVADFFNPKSAGELAAAMVGLDSDHAQLARSRIASTQAATRFSWDKSAAQAVAFYRTVLQHSA